MVVVREFDPSEVMRMKALGPLAQSAVRELASQELGGGINICHICLASRAELIWHPATAPRKSRMWAEGLRISTG
jgi:hypothetical protein